MEEVKKNGRTALQLQMEGLHCDDLADSWGPTNADSTLGLVWKVAKITLDGLTRLNP